MRSFILAIVLTTTSCGAPAGSDAPMCHKYHEHNYKNQFPGPFHYDVNADTVSATGIHVDTSGLSVDLAKLLDKQTDEVEACLKEVFGNPAVVPAEYRMTPANHDQARATPNCDSPTFPMPIERECLTVKVADNAILSENGQQELLPAPSDPQGCYDKGLCLDAAGKPILDCPCYPRAGIQDNAVIVVTPSFYLYKDALIRMVTGCNNPWTLALAKCATASVPSRSSK